MSTKPLTLVVTFQARPGKEAELRKVLTALVAPSRKDAGCLNYDLHVALDDPAKFIFHENWATKAHHEAHVAAPHIQALLPRIDELCVGFPTITMCERID
ncbi:MAG TPA: putative quinol monooxygenase [Candidatus Baltobacteraceae bacterium]|nr:putative quinol monooxygenase [Candidatus Baltobacteraceae bacterium]